MDWLGTGSEIVDEHHLRVALSQYRDEPRLVAPQRWLVLVINPSSGMRSVMGEQCAMLSSSCANRA